MRFRLLPAVLFVAVCTAATTLQSQSFTPIREQKNLSPAAVAKLHTLETLNALPPGDWRLHAGDIPHGESPSLEDSAWPIAAPGSKAPVDAVWYRQLITVPRTLHGYDISGSRISFQFHADANGPMPQIIYFNGRRVALGEDLEPIILTEPARAGERILVAVKLLHTVDTKTFRGVTLRIEPVYSSTSSRPNPDDIRTQAITAANLLPALATPRPDLLPRVEQAVDAIDLAALAAANQPLFDASLRKAQGILASLSPTLAQANVTLAGNAHIDAAWLWPRSETIDVVRRTFTSALQLMDEYPDYTYSQSAAQYTAWIADKYPDLHKQIQKRVKEGRWEIVGGMWVEPDLNIPDGESLVRQLLVGQRYFQKELGVQARIGWNPDSFGYNWQLPQIYKRSGLDYFVTQKMHWNDTNVLPFRLFWWQSPDGSKVLTYFPTDYVHDNVNPTRIAADFAESAQRNPGTTAHLDLYGIGDHGGGPTRAMLDQADHWIAVGKSTDAASKDTSAHAVPTLHYGTAQSFFSTVEKQLALDSPVLDYDSIAKGYTAPVAPGKLALPTWNDELYFEYHRGVQTTQAIHKRNIRQSETQTLDTEKLSSLAWLTGLPYPADALTENWKKITFNQFHDLAAGSGIAVIYRDAQKDFNQVFDTDREMSRNATTRLAAQIDTQTAYRSNAVPLIVYNTLAWPRSETVRLTVQMPEPTTQITLVESVSNRHIPTQVIAQDAATQTFTVLAHIPNLPALGYTVLQAQPGPANAADPLKVVESTTSFTLTNGILTAVIDKQTGCITSLTRTGGPGEFIAPNACGNQLQTYVDTPKNYDAWNIDPGTLDGTMTPITNVDSILLAQAGPVRATIRIERTWQKSHFTQEISLDDSADSLEIANDVSWHETHVLLKAAFPLAASSAKATFEIPYGSIERTTTRNNSWEKAQFEVPALRWADLGNATQGLSLLNDSKYGYDALGNTLRLTLLRSPTWPDPDADRGPQHFVYSIYPHSGSWKQSQTVHRGYELNDPLTATQTFIHTGSLPAQHSFAAVENPNVILTAMKKAEDENALIIRMYESVGTLTQVKLTVPAGALYAQQTNLMEKPEGPHLEIQNNTVTIPIHPYEILTLQLTYPAKP